MTVSAQATSAAVAAAATPEDAIRKGALAAAGLGVPGLFHPGLDETGMGAIWLTMVTTIAKRCGAPLSAATGGKFVTSAVASIAAYSLGSRILTWVASPLLLAFPIAGIPAAVAMNAALNALFTYRLGKESVRRFSDPAFNSNDLAEIGRHLIGIPTFSEIAEIKRLLAG